MSQRDDLRSVLARLSQATSTLGAGGGSLNGEAGDGQIACEMLADLSAAVVHLRQAVRDSGARLTSTMANLSALRAEIDQAGSTADLEPLQSSPASRSVLARRAIIAELERLHPELVAGAEPELIPEAQRSTNVLRTALGRLSKALGMPASRTDAVEHNALRAEVERQVTELDLAERECLQAEVVWLRAKIVRMQASRSWQLATKLWRLKAALLRRSGPPAGR